VVGALDPAALAPLLRRFVGTVPPRAGAAQPRADGAAGAFGLRLALEKSKSAVSVVDATLRAWVRCCPESSCAEAFAHQADFASS